MLPIEAQNALLGLSRQWIQRRIRIACTAEPLPQDEVHHITEGICALAVSSPLSRQQALDHTLGLIRHLQANGASAEEIVEVVRPALKDHRVLQAACGVWDLVCRLRQR